jgi:galactokinase
MSIGAPSRIDLSTPSPEARARALFVRKFGAEPTAMAFAPGRVNLIGDHVDYCDGLVFPAALSDGCVCAVGPRTGAIAAASAEVEGDPVVDVLSPLTPADLSDLPGWFGYVAGTYEVMRSRFAPGAGGVNIAVASEVPPGSGLSSSASLEVSVATALEAQWGLSIDPVDKALACQHAEHVFADTPCGLMDQLVSVSGRAGCAIRIDCRDRSTTAVPLPPAERAAFVIFDSAVSHANGDGGYAERRAACESALPKLGVASLRDVPPDRLTSLPAGLTDPERDAVRHVVTEIDRVRRFPDLLAANDLGAAGALMDDSHRSLSEVFRVSCPELDTLAEIVRAQAGVYGARMTGGGFGGWVVSLVDTPAVPAAAEAVARAYRQATGLEITHRVVRAGDGARVLRA